MRQIYMILIADVAILAFAIMAVYWYVCMRMDQTQEFLDDMLTDFEDRWAGLIQKERLERRELEKRLNEALRRTPQR